MSNLEKTRLKTFHATMVVTRIEEWCVGAESSEEAKVLRAADRDIGAISETAFIENWRK